MNPDQYMRNISQLRNRIAGEVESIIYANEDKICSMNIQKIDNHIGSDGGVLRNLNRKFTGVYQPMTVAIAKVERPMAPKVLGQPYNWVWNGDFMSGFEVNVLNNAKTMEIFSKGEGSGLKRDFFDGYKNLYGLTKEDQYKVNYDIILPKLLDFVNQYI